MNTLVRLHTRDQAEKVSGRPRKIRTATSFVVRQELEAGRFSTGEIA